MTASKKSSLIIEITIIEVLHIIVLKCSKRSKISYEQRAVKNKDNRGIHMNYNIDISLDTYFVLP